MDVSTAEAKRQLDALLANLNEVFKEFGPEVLWAVAEDIWTEARRKLVLAMVQPTAPGVWETARQHLLSAKMYSEAVLNIAGDPDGEEPKPEGDPMDAPAMPTKPTEPTPEGIF